MKKSIIFSLAIFASSLSLIGCNDNTNQNTVSDLKSGIQYIEKEKNYTFSYVSNTNRHDLIYTKTSIGLVAEGTPRATDVYIQDTKGVYRLRHDGSKFISSELSSKSDSLWSGEFYSTLFGVSTSFTSSIKSGDTSVKVSDKSYKIAYCKAIGYSEDQLANVNSLTISYRKENNEQYLRFTLDYLGNDVVYDAHEFGTSKNTIVDDFIASGGTYLTVNGILSDARRLMKGNNYIQEIYYFGADEDSSGYAAQAYFHPHYYMSIYNGSSFGSGAIALNSKKNDLYGCYSCAVQFSDQGATPSLYSPAVYSEPNIPEYYHYPSYLMLWDNFEYLTSWTDQDMLGYTKTGEGYYFNNSSLLADFSNNFSMSSNFSGQIPMGVAIDIVKGATDKDTVIYFYYKFAYQGAHYVMPIPFHHFGNANIGALDYVYSMYND